ncbi:Predicted neuraminidase (sialidase) [Microlunatus sagamiharensis]|uniref:Predicted neuraminidase (Sialidase) n=1 Tax=Microlunatus sagamiharensis TaxID=546874 RepID=A0A1H2NDP8_9ACTN|nr:exo-alpha-sialidase [Microlunatus sagamiharensis]SDV03301.1 Predicted neuraminidase (sialidase) [Microlunatus sagamiharensis]
MTSRYADQAGVVATVPPELFDGRLRPGPGTGRQDAYLATATVQSHAAMLHRLGNGDLGLVWFGGTQEGVGDVSVWFSRLADGAERWSEPVRLSDDGTRSEQNPVLFRTPTGRLWLLYTAQRAGHQDTAEVRRRLSDDDGATWGEAETLFAADEQGGVFVRQPVLVTASGRWLLPVFRCARVPGQAWSGDDDTSSVMISDDEGTTWREVAVPGSTGCVHMNPVELSDGSLHALFRSRWADHVYESRSDDDGETWSVPAPTALPNNNSSIQQQRLADGRLALVYNHASREDATGRRENLYDEIGDDGLVEPGQLVAATAPERDPGARRAFWGAPRAPLSLAFSSDGGATFEVAGDLDEGDGFCLTNNSRDRLNRELSYPAVLEAPDGSLDVAYTWHRQTIKHVRIPAGWRQDA